MKEMFVCRVALHRGVTRRSSYDRAGNALVRYAPDVEVASDNASRPVRTRRMLACSSGGEGFEPSRDETAPNGFRDLAAAGATRSWSGAEIPSESRRERNSARTPEVPHPART